MEKLSKYERARILSARALQVSDGAQVYLNKPSKEINSLNLTEQEFRDGKTPLKVVKGKD